MARTRYVALLRGINVGGKNVVAMADVRAAFERAGFEAVRTFLQSGNVLFTTDAPAASLEGAVEAALARHLGMSLAVVVRSRHRMRAVVADAPEGFGGRPDTYHSDVLFLKAPLSSRVAMQVVETRDGVDRAWPGPGVVYFERLSARRTQSRMSRIVSTPEYARMTIRSWSTTTRLVGLLDEPSA